MDEAIAGFLVMPLWAQIGLGFFALTFLVMVFGPGFERRRYAAKLSALAAAAGATTTRRDEFTEWFTIDVDGRPFEVRRELRMRNSSYRGPTGQLLVTSTPLSGSRWEMHQIDIVPGRVPKIFRRPTVSSGDAKFDERFVVIQDGVPVRDNWLDAPTRAAIITFFDAPAATGPVWVHDRQLQHIAGDEWARLDLAALKGLLRQQAMLASALERTAGWRGNWGNWGQV